MSIYIWIDYDHDCEDESDEESEEESQVETDNDADYVISDDDELNDSAFMDDSASQSGKRTENCMKKTRDAYTEIYPIEKRKEIVDYWLNQGNKRTFKAVQHRYRKITSLDVLRKWKQRIYAQDG